MSGAQAASVIGSGDDTTVTSLPTEKLAGESGTEDVPDDSPATVTLNERVLVSDPAVTVMKIVAVPLRFAVGVTIIVRFTPLPRRTIFVAGRDASSEEIAVTDKDP